MHGLLQHGPILGGVVPRIGFERPVWLWLIPALCLLAWWMARGTLSGWTETRRWVHLGIRCGLIALLVAALAEPRVVRRADDVAVVAVVDVSDSVPMEQRRLAQGFLAGSLSKRPDGDRFGVVTVARDARVQSLPTAHDPQIETDTADLGLRDASDVQKGVDLARALIPADAAGRVLLVSDGNETNGSLAGAATRLLAAGVPIDVAMVEYDRSALARVENVVVPAWVRDGDTINARVVISAGETTPGRLTMMLDGEPVDLDPDSSDYSARVLLDPGTQILTQPLRLPPGSVHRVRAVFEPDNAERSLPQLLSAEGVTFTSARGRVLVIAENREAVSELVRAMSSESISVEVRSAASVPESLAEWAGYDAVVLADQPASNFTQAQQEDLSRYVQDTGGGLLVVGGPNSYGAGGWIGSPLADALPVVLDPPQQRKMPMGGLAIVLDASGSMMAPVTGTTMTQQEIANEAAILGIRTLSRLDQVVVVAFSGDYEVVVPLTYCSNAEGIARKIRAIGPGGGTNMFPAIEAAADQLARSPAGAKHIIVLSDGETTGDPQSGIAMAADLKRRGITVTTVSIGDMSNGSLMEQIARAGGGRFYSVQSQDSRAKLPQIFIKEVPILRRALIWEGKAFSPRLMFAGDSMRGIGTPIPAMTGYIVTGDRGGLSSVLMRGPENDPILAQWQYGLGRVTAYTSDGTTRWNAAWPGWGAFNAFWSQQIKWVMRPGDNGNARLTVDARNERAKVTVELMDNAGERVNFARMKSRVAGPNSEVASRDVLFRQVGPGRYEAEVDAATVGSHILSMRYETPGGEGEESRMGSLRAAIVRRGGEELRQPSPNANLLYEVARRTDGRVYRLDPAGADLWVRERLTMPESARAVWLMVALAALGLFIVDVAARRVTLDPKGTQAKLAALLSAAPTAKTAQTATLAQAKARATTTHELAARNDVPARTEQRATDTQINPRVLPTQASSAPVIERPRSTNAGADGAESGDRMSRLRAAKKRSGGEE